MSEPVLIWSEQRDKIVPAYYAARKAMGPLKKNAKNDHFKSKYADLSAVNDTIDDELEKQELLPIQAPTCVRVDGEWAARIDTEIIHIASGQSVRAITDLPLAKADAQGGGSGFTYARRYALQAMFGLAPEDDDGNAASQRTPKREQAKIDAVRVTHFETFIGKNLPPIEVDALVRKAQAQYGFEQTGKVEDLHDGDEAKYAYNLLKKAIKDSTGEAA